jgi:hypothetical protein
MASKPSRAFYCVSNARYFPGVAATINSLRLLGHSEPILLLDCGLTEAQRRLLDNEVELHDAAEGSPYLMKHVLPLRHPAEAMLVIDADVIITQSLEPLFAQAGPTKLAGFADALPDRSYSAWSDLLGFLPPGRQSYVNAGTFVVGWELGATLMENIRLGLQRVDLSKSMYGTEPTPQYPLYFLDQDVLNAYIVSHVPAEDVHVMEHRLAPHPPFPNLELRNEQNLQCIYPDGVEPFVLHHAREKPWLSAVQPTVYSKLLRRLLLDDDVRIRVPPTMLPLRMRRGALAMIERRRSSATAGLRRLRWRAGVRRRLDTARSRL